MLCCVVFTANNLNVLALHLSYTVSVEHKTLIDFLLTWIFVVNVVKYGGCQLISLRWWWFFPVWSIDADNCLFAKPNLMQVVGVL